MFHLSLFEVYVRDSSLILDGCFSNSFILMGQHVISFVDSAYSVNYSRPPALFSAFIFFVL